MSYNGTEEYEETIDLKDLCIYIFRKWRMILLAMVVFALLLGAYKAVSSSNTEAELTTAEEDSLEAAKQAVSDNLTAQKTAQSSIDKSQQTIVLMEQSIETQENVRALYERDLAELEALLEESESIEDKTYLIVQINELSVKLENINTEIAGYEDTIDDCAAAIVQDGETLEGLKEKAVELEEAYDALEESLSQKVAPVSISSVIKYAVLGAILGIFLVCVVAFLVYLFNGKLRGADEMRERYGVRVLGSLYRTPVRRRGPLDRLLDRWDENGRPVDEEKTYELTAAGIRIMSADEEGRVTLLVTGTSGEEKLAKVQERLGALLPENGFSVEILPDPVTHADSMLRIRDGLIVLAEEPGATKKKDLDRLADLLQAAKAKVIGAVLL